MEKLLNKFEKEVLNEAKQEEEKEKEKEKEMRDFVKKVGEEIPTKDKYVRLELDTDQVVIGKGWAGIEYKGSFTFSRIEDYLSSKTGYFYRVLKKMISEPEKVKLEMQEIDVNRFGDYGAKLSKFLREEVTEQPSD